MRRLHAGPPRTECRGLAKHFLAIGDTDTDSHKALPVIPFPAAPGQHQSLPLPAVVGQGPSRSVMVARLNNPLPWMMPSRSPPPVHPIRYRICCGRRSVLTASCSTDAMDNRGRTQFTPMAGGGGKPWRPAMTSSSRLPTCRLPSTQPDPGRVRNGDMPCPGWNPCPEAAFCRTDICLGSTSCGPIPSG